MMSMGNMRLSLDPKPIGAFIEYTLKPLIDYSRELIDILDERGVGLKSSLDYAIKLYIIDLIVRSIVTLLCTGMICLTAYYCLHLAK